MISLVAQERLLGFALGGVLVGAAVLEQRKAIRRSVIDQDLAPASTEASHPVPRRKVNDLDVAQTWNKAVDRSLAHLIAVLSSRGW